MFGILGYIRVADLLVNLYALDAIELRDDGDLTLRGNRQGGVGHSVISRESHPQYGDICQLFGVSFTPGPNGKGSWSSSSPEPGAGSQEPETPTAAIDPAPVVAAAAPVAAPAPVAAAVAPEPVAESVPEPAPASEAVADAPADPAE